MANNKVDKFQNASSDDDGVTLDFQLSDGSPQDVNLSWEEVIKLSDRLEQLLLIKELEEVEGE